MQVINDQESYNEFKEYLTKDNPRIYKTTDNTIITADYKVKVTPPYKDLISIANPFDQLIYGKSPLTEIVSISVYNDNLHIYFLDGTSLVKSNTYWILAPRQYDSKFTKLEGNQHYKYIRTFNTFREYSATAKKYRSKDIYKISNQEEAAMVYGGYTYFKGLQTSQIPILSFDIESEGLKKYEESDVYVITNTFRKGGEIIRKHFRVDDYSNCGEMIEDWCCWVQSVDPKIIVGHNIFGYDFPYLKYCANMHGRELILGCDNSEMKTFRYTSKFRVDGNTEWEYNKINIVGREVIDTMFTSVKYDIGRNYPSWGLKPIIEHHGLVAEDRQFYDASKISKNWHDPVEREKIVKYGIQDSDDALALFDIQCPSLFYMNQSVPKSFQEMGTSASGSQLNSMLVRSYLQQGYSIANTNKREQVSGGISFGVPGNYKNVFKIDIKSMYPSIIRGFKLFPKEKDPNEHYLKIANIFTEERFKNKRLYKETGDKYYDDMQAAQKIVINSLYGLMGASGLNYNNFSLANEITGIARQIIKTTILWATGKKIQHWFPDYEDQKDMPYEGTFKTPENTHDFRIPNADTDSISICNHRDNDITKEQQDQLIDEINGLLPDMIEYEDDGYFNNVLIVKAKNYVLYDGKLKYKGSSLVDSKKEPALRELLRRLIDDIMFNGSDTLVDIYNEYIRAVRDCQDVSKWCTKKSISSKVLNPERANESKVLDAVQHLNPREGDKYLLFNIIDGEKPEMKKGEQVILKKTGQVKMVPNRVLKVYEEGLNMDDFVFDRTHYYERVYKTISILENVVDMDQFIKYHLKSNIDKVEEL